MQQKQDMGQVEQSNTHTSAEETHKSNSPFEHTAIENTPFICTGNEETGYIARLGDYRLTDKYDTTLQLREALEREHFNIVYRMVAGMLDKMEKLHQILQKIEENEAKEGYMDSR